MGGQLQGRYLDILPVRYPPPLATILYRIPQSMHGPLPTSIRGVRHYQPFLLSSLTITPTHPASPNLTSEEEEGTVIRCPDNLSSRVNNSELPISALKIATACLCQSLVFSQNGSSGADSKRGHLCVFNFVFMLLSTFTFEFVQSEATNQVPSSSFLNA
ncbi:hypothetical protein ARMSODRAFT_967002 [Armillaria solidipes]|uniref:Uncharacterized protein n=1 Tax=Armillaria solidipes TaxID=1076256 RepID=A0A2H3B8H3_9AGAR|nr:hypothetical protein ARMSODRAFT_967002 [Armillaria solidipes]